MAKAWQAQVDDLDKSLRKALSPRNIALAMIGGSSPTPYASLPGPAKEIIHGLIAAAQSGHGPRGAQFPAYSSEYAKRKQAAGNVRWLRGMAMTGAAGGMLGRERFSCEVQGDKLYLVWTSAGGQMDIYARVHQEGLPIGKNGPRKQRKWMQLDNLEPAGAVAKAVEWAVGRITMEWNRKHA